MSPRRGMRAVALALLCVTAVSACSEEGESPPRSGQAPPASAGPADTGADQRRKGGGDAGGDEATGRPEADETPARLGGADPVGPSLEPDRSAPQPPSGPSPEPPLPDGVSERPEWLGREALPERGDGHAVAQTTPEELVDRRLATPARAAEIPALEGDGFDARIEHVPDEVAERSTWRPECPVGHDDLRYVRVAFAGFDERRHTGELLVHERVAEDIVRVFERLYEARFPLEEMRILSAEELAAAPTGDGNNTSAFECRDIAGSSRSWSQHAYGLAIDINPFHNPYLKGDLVIPELAEAYLDRDHHRPGMIQPGDVVTGAFAEIGWGWGGEWQSLDDWMHFSESGR